MLRIAVVPEGQRIAVWDHKGNIEYVDGPRRLVLWRKRTQWLFRYSAAAQEYLAVEHVDGRVEHMAGPASVWQDPVRYKEIRVEKALPIDSHEAIVIYQQLDGEVARRVLWGPAVYVPQEKEWLHRFQWHGADPKDMTRKIPRGLQFTKLWVIPDQMYFDVDEVRTADDALLVIKLMVFFELVDVETMLDQTHDPIADFINALTADVIEFVGSRSFEQFKLQTDKLNVMETYTNLVRRAAGIGYKINNVVYRGYLAGEKLQVMHDNAIETRTGLKLGAETEQQAQDLADLKLQREARRTLEQQALEQQAAEHQLQLDRNAHAEQLRQHCALEEQELATKKASYALEREHEAAQHQSKLDYLKTMREMQVDLTRYLVAQYQHPDRLIRISGDNDAQLHLHDN